MSSPSASATHSLYRKYRPTSFADDDLVGQEHVVNTLRNAIVLDRISHAYLFCGPRGTGKTTTARLLAKAVNCLDSDPQARPCNTCTSCIAINSNATTDVIEIDAASNRGIDDIRDLRERVKYAPAQLATKFYIIDEAHQITGAAANAFLKTLEEPPPHTKFILATTDPEELLQTIVSRCQRFDFRRINLEAMLARLRTVATREAIEIDDEALTVIARQGTGSLRDALGMLDQVAVYRESDTTEAGPVTADLVRSVLGVSRNERVEILTRALADRDPAAGLREISAAVDAGDDIRQLGRQLVAYIRLLLLEKAGGNPDADSTARNLAGRFSLEELAGLIRQLADLDFRAKRSAFPQLPLEIAIVEGTQRGLAQQHEQSTPRQAAVPPTPDPSPQVDNHAAPPESEPVSRTPRTSLRDRVRGVSPSASPMTPREAPQPSSGEKSTSSSAPRKISEQTPQAPPPTRSENAATTAPGEVNLDMIVSLWSKIRADVKAVNRRIEALLQQVDPAAVSGAQVVLVSPYEFHRNRVNTDDVRQTVENVITRLIGSPVQVICVTREEAQRIGGGAKAVTVAPTPSPITEITEPKTSTEPGIPEVMSIPSDTTSSMTDMADTEESPEQAQRDEHARIQAAKNIFDAEEILD